MSGGDLIEYFGSEEQQQPSDMLDRKHQGIFNSIQQRRLELEADGLQEGSGMGSISGQRHDEERKGRIERRGESQRINREIVGAQPTTAVLKGMQEGMINAGKSLGMDLVGNTLIEGFGKIGEVIQSGLSVVEQANDFINRGREQFGAGALADVESILSGVSSANMTSSEIYREIGKKLDDIVGSSKMPSIANSEHSFWNRVYDPNEYSMFEDKIEVLPRISAENKEHAHSETPDGKHDDFRDDTSDSSSKLWADLENASAFRNLDRPPGGRRTSSWIDGVDLSGIDLNGDGKIDKVELAVSKTGNALTNDIKLLHPLLAKAHRHPNFLRTKIEQKKIQKESPHNRNTQVNLVQQGEANFMKDFNQFNVNF